MEESYRQWVMNKTLEVKLPFPATVAMDEEPPITILEENEDMDQEDLQGIKTKLTQLKKDEQKLEVELIGVQKAYEALQLESVEKNKSLKNANKKATVEEQRKNNTKHYLDATYVERD